MSSDKKRARESAHDLPNEADAELESIRKKQATELDGSKPDSTITLKPDDIKEVFCSSVQVLKDYILSTDLLKHDLGGKNLPDNIIAELKKLIHQVSKVCLSIIKPDTPFILELLSKDSNANTLDWEQDKKHWMNVIMQLNLTDQQIGSILRSRESHVAAMMSLYMERAVLCKQASDMASKSASTSSILSPNSSLYAEEDSSTMGLLMKYGYLWCAQSTVALNRVLDLIRENQLREQRTVMELFLRVIYQILSPVQAALFIVEAFPYHCDSLAMANVLVTMSKMPAGPGSQPPVQADCFQRLNGLLDRLTQ